MPQLAKSSTPSLRCNLAAAAPQPAGRTLASTDRTRWSAITKEHKMKRLDPAISTAIAARRQALAGPPDAFERWAASHRR
jgi:hypothetical protein